MWQLSIVNTFWHGAWGNISNIRLAYGSDGQAESFPSGNLTCFNIQGVDQSGKSFTLSPFVNTTLGSILPLWLGIDIGMSTRGSLGGRVTITADVDGYPWSAHQNYSVHVSGTPLFDRGDSNASLLSRVRWLNSRFGLDNTSTAAGGQSEGFELPAPFTPIKPNKQTLSLFLGKGKQTYFQTPKTTNKTRFYKA